MTTSGPSSRTARLILLGWSLAAAGCISVGGRLRLDDWSSYSDVETTKTERGEPAGPSLSLRVMDLEGGALPDAFVEVEGPGGPQNCHTDSRGSASRSLGPGEWHVRVSALGWHPVSRRIVIREGRHVTLTAYLRPVAIA
jgi:hypothetical protein